MRTSLLCTLAFFTLQFGLTASDIQQAHVSHTVTYPDTKTAQVTLNFNITPPDFIYHDFIACSVDSPDVTLDSWNTSIAPETHYDPTFKQTKKMYMQPMQITMTAQNKTDHAIDATIVCAYYIHSQQKNDQYSVPLQFPASNDEASLPITSHISHTTAAPSQDQRTCTVSPQTWSSYISSWVTDTDSFAIQLALVMLLGLMLSLTPCIYPMIPITVGILQSQAHKSIGRNFLLSLSYSLGIATTFALLGLSAAYTGQMVGNIMTKPIVVIAIVALLFYLSLSMIGLYDMYIPRFLQNTSTTYTKSSLLTAFLFGAMSGTVASPCLSPGLLLLLTLVTTLANKFMGFALLFAFGIGLSVPLLIIGTFSSSLQVLPRAGMWMVEVKQFFGFIMLGMCIYFLQYIVPLYVTYALTACLCITTGIFYLYQARKNPSSTSSYVKNIVGMILLALSIPAGSYVIKSWYYCKETCDASCAWLSDYTAARACAQQECKPILIDVSTPFCSLCKAIDKKVLTPDVVNQCKEYCVPVKIDGSDDDHTAHSALLKKYNVVGAPTFILVNPETEDEITRWGGEVYDQTSEKFVDQLKQHSIIK